MSDSKRKRTTIDLSSVAERIEKIRSDSAWRALTLSKKAILLLEEYLTLLEEQARHAPPERQKPQTLAELVQQHYWALKKANIKNIDVIAEGGTATQADLIRISSVVGIDLRELEALAAKGTESGKKNGCTNFH